MHRLIMFLPVVLCFFPSPSSSHEKLFAKRALYWKGDLIAKNASAAAAVRARGFTHATTSSLEGAAALHATGLLPLLLLTNQPFALRNSTPFANWTDYIQRVSSMQVAVRGGGVAGVADDIEEHPFPHTCYTADGRLDAHNSHNFSDLAQRIGSEPNQGKEWHPAFEHWPKPGAHPPNLTMEMIEYNFPRLVSPRPPSPAVTGYVHVPEDAHAIAQPFVAPATGHITRIDLPLWRVHKAPTTHLGPTPASMPTSAVDYFVCPSAVTGGPDVSRPLICAGCQVQPREVPLLTHTFHPTETHNSNLSTNSSLNENTTADPNPYTDPSLVPPLRLYLDPDDHILTPGVTYFLVVRWSQDSLAPGMQQYALGTSTAPSEEVATAALPYWMWSGGSGKRTPWVKNPASRVIPLDIYTPQPPPGFGVNQLHLDWVSFQCSVNARFVQAYKAAMHAPDQQVGEVARVRAAYARALELPSLMYILQRVHGIE